MAYLDNINTNSTDYAINSFANLLLASGGVTDAKTVTFPNGYDVTDGSNMTFRVLFPYGHNGQANMTLNGVDVVVNKNGTLIPLPYHNISSTYKSLQANTVLEMYYTSNYDGNNTPAFVIVGNPIVLSSNNYIIYADGKNVTDVIYPVGSLYWSSKSTNPSTLFGGTWVQIKDKFILACGDTYKTVGATGGASSVTLSVDNMPSHTHSFTPSGEVSSHSHTINSGNTSSAGTETTAGIRHSGSTSGMSANSTGSFKVINFGTSVRKGVVTNVTGMLSDDTSTNSSDPGAIWEMNNICVGGSQNFYGYHTIKINVSHTHTLPSSYIYGNTESTQPTFRGYGGTTSPEGSGSAFNILPPYVVKYCWERTA